MRDDEFEWDDGKAARNLRDHGVAFEVFRDASAVEWIDEGQDDTEERFVTIGMVESRLLFVSYTLRGSRIRIISARVADPYERRKYHNADQT